MSDKHRFRFGMNAIGSASRASWRATAQKAEALGFSTLSVADHLWTGLAPLTSLMAAAEATTTLRIGSLVFGNDFRHPVALAREAATLDLLSEGRLELGLGTGWQNEDYTQPGIALDAPGTRVSRFEEAVQLLKLLFADGPVSFAGKYYAVTGLDNTPKPVQRPHPPLLLGGGSPRMLSIAAREADIVSINIRTTAEGGLDFGSVSLAATEQKVQWVRQAAGEHFGGLELNTLVMAAAVTDKPQEAAAQMARNWGMEPNPGLIAALLESPTFLFGSVAEISDLLQMRRERLGISYFTIFGEGQMEALAPVVARLAGT